MMDIEHQIGVNIRRLRLEMGLSQEALARLVGATGRHLGRIERGSISVTIGLLARIADALNSPVGDLLSRRDTPMPPNLPRGRRTRDGDGAPTDPADAPDAAFPFDVLSDPALKSDLETIRRVLNHERSGFLSQATEKIIGDLIRQSGGEENLTAAQRKNIELARALAAAKDATRPQQSPIQPSPSPDDAPVARPIGQRPLNQRPFNQR